MKFKIHAKALFFVGLIQAGVTALLGIQASGTTGIQVHPESPLSLVILGVTVVGAMTNYVASNATPIDTEDPVL